MKKLTSPVLITLAFILAISAAPVSAGNDHPPYYSVETITLEDGILLEQAIINGPPQPPLGYDLEHAAVALPEPNQAMGINILPVPAYEWSFGCSATAGAMIAAYYDRTGFPNMYTGPTDGGVMPLTSLIWGTWRDGNGVWYDQSPLAASRAGLDGRSTRGSIEDHWVGYGSSVQDPYITNGWVQHAPGEAIGDYMRTSQSAYDNVDGATSFWNWLSSTSPFTCADVAVYGIANDGTYGRKLFYEARGYTVTDCYSQKAGSSGFTFAMYKAEIDAARPVMLNLEGHTVVGIGYDDATSTVYIHDTWNLDVHPMTWGGSYEGMALQSVSIVNLERPMSPDIPPVVASASGSDMVLEWPSAGADITYEVWRSTSPYFTPGSDDAVELPDICAHIGEDMTCTDTGAVGDPGANYTYVVRATNLIAPPTDSHPAGVFTYQLVKGSEG